MAPGLPVRKGHVMNTRKLLLDMDTGIDDAMAITYALADGSADLIGVTCCFGNVTNQTAVRNTLDLLSIMGRPDIPVFYGAEHPLDKDSFRVSDACIRIHGANGLGNVSVPHSGEPADISAPDFILDAAGKYGENLILVATGALTNLAAALRKDKETFAKIGKIVFMGGALTVEGNVTPYAEANIAVDPLAAKEVLESGIPMTMIGLDVTHKNLLTRTEAARWRSHGSAGKALYEIVAHYIDNELEQKSCSLHDPLAVAAALDETMVETHPFAMTVVTEGEAAGRTIACPFADQCENKNVSVALETSPRFVPKFVGKIESFLAAREKEEAAKP